MYIQIDNILCTRKLRTVFLGIVPEKGLFYRSVHLDNLPGTERSCIYIYIYSLAIASQTNHMYIYIYTIPSPAKVQLQLWELVVQEYIISSSRLQIFISNRVFRNAKF